MGKGEMASERPPWIRQAILAGQRYHVRTKSPLLHNGINLGASLVLVLVLIVVAWGATVIHPAIYVPLAAYVFGNTYFALFVLVVHEASHGMFLISRNRRARDILNRLAGWSVAIFFATHYPKHWEVGHLEHHVRPLEPTDPQAHNTLTGGVLLRRVLACVFVPGFLFLERTVFRKRKSGGKSGSTSSAIIGFVVVWIVSLTLLTLTCGWPAALAAFLGIHVIVAFNHVKGSLEHGGPIGHEEDPFLRSRSTFFPGRFFLMPFNISLHFEHHLNYGVPWYELLRYHRDLEEIVPEHVREDVWNHRPLSQLAGALGGVRQASEA
jgi:fatty acid desaturase